MVPAEGEENAENIPGGDKEEKTKNGGVILKNRHTGLIVALALLVVVLLPGISSAGEIIIRVNDTIIRPDVPAQVINGRTMVPVRFVAQALNCQVDWNEATQSVLIASDGHYEGSPPPNDTGQIRIYVNGNILYPDVPPQLINGRTMVPVRFIAETLGARVGWDESSQTVIITRAAPGTGNAVTAVRPPLVGPYLDAETQILLEKRVDAAGREVLAPAQESQVPISAGSPTICASAVVENGLAGQRIQAVLEYNYGQSSLAMGEIVFPQSGTRYVGFKLTKSMDQWPIGRYEVKVYVDGVFKVSTPFTVE